MAEVNRIFTDAINEMQGIDFLKDPNKLTVIEKDAFLKFSIPNVLEEMRLKSGKSNNPIGVKIYENMLSLIKENEIGIVLKGHPNTPQIQDVSNGLKVERVVSQESGDSTENASVGFYFSVHRGLMYDLWFDARHPRVSQVLARLVIPLNENVEKLKREGNFIEFHDIPPELIK